MPFGRVEWLLAGLRVVMDVREFDPKTKMLERISEEKTKELAHKISPVTHVTADAAPTLIIHGDADVLVPIQQAEVIMARFKDAGVPAELVIRKGRGHDFKGADKDFPVIVDWIGSTNISRRSEAQKLEPDAALSAVAQQRGRRGGGGTARWR
jgi:acetyl esterase/lipase